MIYIISDDTNSPFLYTEHLNVCFSGRLQNTLLLNNSWKYKRLSLPVEWKTVNHMVPVSSPIIAPKNVPILDVHFFTILEYASAKNNTNKKIKIAQLIWLLKYIGSTKYAMVNAMK